MVVLERVAMVLAMVAMLEMVAMVLAMVAIVAMLAHNQMYIFCPCRNMFLFQ